MDFGINGFHGADHDDFMQYAGEQCDGRWPVVLVYTQRRQCRCHAAAGCTQHRMFNVVGFKRAVRSQCTENVQHDDHRNDDFPDPHHEGLDPGPSVDQYVFQFRDVIVGDFHRHQRKFFFQKSMLQQQCGQHRE